jgi:hypothetical protein
MLIQKARRRCPGWCNLQIFRGVKCILQVIEEKQPAILAAEIP